MKRRNRFIAAVAIACMVGQVSTFAAVPANTVIINDKAFDMNAKKDLESAKEILNLLKNVENEVYVNTLEGLVTDHSKKAVSEKRLPAIEYKDENGKVTYYDAKNGEEIKFGVNKAIFIDNNIAEISLNTPGSKEELLKKENYKIGGKELGENDKIELSEDGKTVKVTLGTPLEKKNIETSIEISKEIKDINGEALAENVKSDLVIIQDKFQENIEGKNVVVLGSNITLENINIKGNVYLQGDNIKVKGCEIKGEVQVDTKKDSAVVIEKSNIDTLTISNETKNVELKGAEIANLNIESNNSTKVSILEDTKVKNATIATATEIVQKKGSIGNVVVDFLVTEENKTLKLNGTFPSITAVFDCKIVAEKGSKVTVNVKTEAAEDQINLEGYYEKVKVESNAEINLGEGTKVNVIQATVDVEINTDKNVEIGKVEGDIEVGGSGAITGGNPATPPSGGGGGGGGSITPPPVVESKADEIIRKIAEGVIKTWNEYEELNAIATAKYEKSTNTATITIAEGKENIMIKDLYALEGKEKALESLINNTAAINTIKFIVEGQEKGIYDYAAQILNIELVQGKDKFAQIVDAVKGMDESKMKGLVKAEYERLLANEGNAQTNGTNAQIKLCEDNGREVSRVKSIEVGGKYLYGGDGNQLKTTEEIKAALGLDASTPIMQTKLGELKGKTIKINFTEGKAINIVLK